jgi:biopolymer transport protein ExbD
MKLKSRYKHRALIDITSLIDLVFLLVAFFMVTSSLGSESSITVHLPRAVQAGDYRPGNIIVTVNENDEVFIDDVKIDKNMLLAEFKGRKETLKDGTVIIRGDRKSSYETIVSIIDKLNQAGIPKFSISAIK